MKELILAAGLCICWVLPSAADEVDSTFEKANRYLHGAGQEQPQQIAPAGREHTPDHAKTQYEQPSPEPSSITWDFETGDLTGWSASGQAFKNQPTYGDNPTARRRGQPSNHQGDFWIGAFENRPTHRHAAGKTQGDGPQGTLTSDPFTIKSNTISFLIGGGCDLDKERVELLIDGRVVDKATGKCTETMARDSFPVAKYLGKTAQIRLVDDSRGGWGHINFDDVRFE